MKNNENDYNEDRKAGSLITDNDKGKPEIVLPEETPAKILPIIDKGNKKDDDNKIEKPDEDNLNAGINEADEMDNSGR
jgi:hypothetical protein